MKVMVTMSEVVRYRRTFTLEELARLLEVPATEDAVRAALDAGNSNYGLASPTEDESENASLLDALIPPGDTSRWVDEVEDREWGFRFQS